MSNRPVVIGVKHLLHPEVVVFALEEARRRGAPLRVVHASERRGVGRALFDDVRSAAYLDSRYDAVDVDCEQVSGTAVDVLLKEAASSCCLVVGTDDVAWTARAAGSAIARQVALCADSPVVVVPRTEHPGRMASGVVVALDMSCPVDGQLAFAFGAARSRHEHLEVVHAAGTVSDYPGRQDHAYKLEDVVDRWRRRFPDVTVHTSVEPGHPVATCLGVATGASLLVVGQPSGSHPRIGPRSFVVKLLRRSGVPVAVVPPGHDLEQPAR